MTELHFEPSQLAELLPEWLPNQRWFAGKQRLVAQITTRLLSTIGPEGHAVQIWIFDITYEDGVSQLYQLPLTVTDSYDDTLGHAFVGEIDGRFVYDAMWDKRVTQAWLAGIVEETSQGGTTFHRTVDIDKIPLGATSLVLTGEQSNTSVVFGDQAILKVFRRLEVGFNPDIEIHAALGELGGRHVARLLGYATADYAGGSISLVMLQEFMSTATDGWDLAKTSVRDLMAEADLHAEEAGGDFAGEAFRLGQATADVHSDLATAFGTELLDAEQMRARADDMITRLDEAVSLVPQLEAIASGLRARYEDFAASEPISVQRIHGDLHLGQVLRTLKGWVVLDFEGEPVKTIASRREKDSTLRDVAGMMRSFDYAANHQVIDSSSNSQLAYRAREWSQRNRDAFCAGYAHASGTQPQDTATLLRVFEADKAVYEAVYEARNRPAWLPVPLASLSRLTAATSA